MITDIYPDPGNGALIVCSDDSVWDLYDAPDDTVGCARLAVTAYGKIDHRSVLQRGDRWVTVDDLTAPTVGAA